MQSLYQHICTLLLLRKTGVYLTWNGSCVIVVIFFLPVDIKFVFLNSVGHFLNRSTKQAALAWLKLLSVWRIYKYSCMLLNTVYVHCQFLDFYAAYPPSCLLMVFWEENSLIFLVVKRKSFFRDSGCRGDWNRKDEVFDRYHTVLKLLWKYFLFFSRSGLMVALPMAFLSCLLDEPWQFLLSAVD